jgi:hypothetical protein
VKNKVELGDTYYAIFHVLLYAAGFERDGNLCQRRAGNYIGVAG